jgi:hypothetical protein
MDVRTGSVLLVALVACGGSSNGDASGGADLSQETVWSISAQTNALGNNMEIDVENLYGYSPSGLIPLTAVTALAERVHSTLASLATSVCADDAKAGDAASAAEAIVTFLHSLPSGGGTTAMLTAQTNKEEALSAALRSAIAASKCVSLLDAPNGSTTAVTGSDISSAISISNGGETTSADLEVPIKADGAFPAVAIENQSSDPLAIASITVDYVDGTSRSIGFGTTQEDGSAKTIVLSATVDPSTTLVVDVDDRAIHSITLVGASLSCPQPGTGTGGNGFGVVCTGSVKVVGLSKSNGLSP